AEKLRDSRAREFGPLADPRTAIAQWDAETPLLLLPVRLETRFKQVAADTLRRAEATRDELWVRIYPDDCAIDNFEPELSETEYASARRFWVDTWAAGDDDGQQRAAWRNLVASHGAGRATWIVRQTQPPDPAPVRPPKGVILVIVSDMAPS